MRVASFPSHECADDQYALSLRPPALPKRGANDNPIVHKLFANLLRETGRNEGTARNIGVLLHHETEGHLRRGVRRIDRNEFLPFGGLIPVAAVFVLTEERPGYEQKTWAEFHD